jgi:hypothetical protein
MLQNTQYSNAETNEKNLFARWNEEDFYRKY